MTKFHPRISGVTVLAAAVLVLLPALAWLQYSWLDQIADADRERRERTLRTAASQLSQDFDGEIGKAAVGLQIEPSTVEQGTWSKYAQRYQMWADAALTPDIVKAVYFVEAPTTGGPGPDAPLRVWDMSLLTFSPTPWPEELAGIHKRLIHDAEIVVDLHSSARGRGERGLQRMLLPPPPAGDEQSIVLPIVRITMGNAVGNVQPGPPDVKLLGFTILRLNIEALGGAVLPTLVRRHLYDPAGHTDFLVSVVSRADPTRVIFESEPGAAAATSDTPDVTASLLGPRAGSIMFMARDERREGGGGRPGISRGPRLDVPPPPPPAPSSQAATDNVVVNVIEARRLIERGGASGARALAGGAEGLWRLAVKHRAGSLEAAVSAARTRNFVLSSGILLLLATAIGLIVVSARRADQLARQQLEFVAAVSHELRTPVSVIGAAAGNLADGVVEEPGRVKKYGATIQTEARRLAETVERVLQLAGIAAGRAAASPSLVSGHMLINDALGAVHHEIEAAGVTLERHVPDVLPSVRGDAMALRSALQNLIGNAVKYAGERRWVRLSARATGRTLRILVEDHGIGIHADDRKHIFEPFYRGREAVSRQIQGSGLGLHLVRRIVEAHGGTVTVQSEAGSGSTFTMELPVAPDDPSTAGVPHESAVAAGLPSSFRAPAERRGLGLGR